MFDSQQTIIANEPARRLIARQRESDLDFRFGMRRDRDFRNFRYFSLRTTLVSNKVRKA
jgi:hypothetical protein